MKKAHPLIFTILLLCSHAIPDQNQKSYDFVFIYSSDLYAGRWSSSERILIKSLVNDAAISPDGQNCAYVRYDEKGDPSIYVLNFFTKKEYKLQTGFKNNYEPVWSADNRHITFEAWHDEYKYIAVVHATTHRVIVIDKEKSYGFRQVYGAAWTKDGRYIIYDDRKDVYLCDTNGKRVRKFELTDSIRIRLKHSTRFMLTCDQRYLLYSAESEALEKRGFYISGVFAFNTQTKRVQQLTRKGENCYLSWVTAKNEIYFSAYDKSKMQPVICKTSVTDTAWKVAFKKVTTLITRN